MNGLAPLSVLLVIIQELIEKEVPSRGLVYT